MYLLLLMQKWSTTLGPNVTHSSVDLLGCFVVEYITTLLLLDEIGTRVVRDVF